MEQLLVEMLLDGWEFKHQNGFHVLEKNSMHPMFGPKAPVQPFVYTHILQDRLSLRALIKVLVDYGRHEVNVLPSQVGVPDEPGK